MALTGTAYVGYAAGFRHGVVDWYGFHEQVSGELGLPFFDDFLSIEVTAFRAAVDQDGDGEAGVTELLSPPDGLFGYTVGVTAGVDAFPDPLPVEFTLSDGYWEPHKEAIRRYYERFQEARFLGFKLPIKVRLVDAWDGTTCDEMWPLVDDEQDCVIEFGDPEKSRTRRALHLARSICSRTGGCALPISWPVAGAAVAIARLRDKGLAPSEFCPGIVSLQYAGRTLDPERP